jgi:hypothetical protein
MFEVRGFLRILVISFQFNLLVISRINSTYAIAVYDITTDKILS